MCTFDNQKRGGASGEEAQVLEEIFVLISGRGSRSVRNRMLIYFRKLQSMPSKSLGT